VRVAYINYSIDLTSTATLERATRWTASLLDRAYGSAQRNKRIKLLINPYGGAGKAAKLYTREIEPIFAAARCQVDVERTQYSGHAKEIARNLDVNAYDVLASASGDGLPHEVINGLAMKSNAAEALRKVAVVQLPCGTGNAMSWNLSGTGTPSVAALNIVKGVRTSLDLASVTQGGTRTLSFLSQSVAIVAESDLGTDNIRWMGDARFVVGFLVRLLGKTLYPCEIAVNTKIEDKQEIKRHYATLIAERKRSGADPNLTDPVPGAGLPPLRYGTPNTPLDTDAGWSPLTSYPNLGNFYCGNMSHMDQDHPFFPAALPSDGLLDLVTIDGDIGRLHSLKLLLAVENGTFFDIPCVNIRKVNAVRVIPKYGKWAEKCQEPQRKSRLGNILDRTGVSGGNKEDRDGGYFSVDGEKLPFEPFQIEVHKGLGTSLCKRPGLYESIGPPGWENIDVTVDVPLSKTDVSDTV